MRNSLKSFYLYNEMIWRKAFSGVSMPYTLRMIFCMPGYWNEIIDPLFHIFGRTRCYSLCWVREKLLCDNLIIQCGLIKKFPSVYQS